VVIGSSWRAAAGAARRRLKIVDAWPGAEAGRTRHRLAQVPMPAAIGGHSPDGNPEHAGSAICDLLLLAIGLGLWIACRGSACWLAPRWPRGCC
jgi:hypothetical protein